MGALVRRQGRSSQSKPDDGNLDRGGGGRVSSPHLSVPFFPLLPPLLSAETLKIQLNGAIFSFAFEGHFSCSGNSCHSDGDEGAPAP